MLHDFDSPISDRTFHNYKLTCTDPYGFVAISNTRGPTPIDLQGSFTSYQQAEQAITAYLSNKEKEPATKEKK